MILRSSLNQYCGIPISLGSHRECPTSELLDCVLSRLEDQLTPTRLHELWPPCIRNGRGHGYDPAGQVLRS
jgi:hypothetical protein